jgi:hypothetical protein
VVIGGWSQRGTEVGSMEDGGRKKGSYGVAAFGMVAGGAGDICQVVGP